MTAMLLPTPPSFPTPQILYDAYIFDLDGTCYLGDALLPTVRETITRLRDGLTLFIDNRDRLEAAVARNSGMKTSALEATGMLKQAAAAGLAKGQEVQTSRGREPPERDRSIVKPFEIGI